MKKRTFILSGIMSLCLLLGAGSAFAGQQEITVFLNNAEQITFDVAPVIENGRTLVPMRAIGEALGISVEWDQKAKKVYCVGETLYCTELTIGKNTAARYQLEPDESNLDQLYGEMTVTGEITEKTMDVPAKVVQGRTLVPLRFLSETYGCEVQYDGTKKRINIVTDTENPASYQEEPAGTGTGAAKYTWNMEGMSFFGKTVSEIEALKGPYVDSGLYQGTKYFTVGELNDTDRLSFYFVDDRCVAYGSYLKWAVQGLDKSLSKEEVDQLLGWDSIWVEDLDSWNSYFLSHDEQIGIDMIAFTLYCDGNGTVQPDNILHVVKK